MRTAIAILMMLALAAGPLYGGANDQPPATPAEEQPEVLTSGPVHEAFAEPVNLQVQAGLVVPDQPPAKIEEVPPVDRPQGAQFVWVPGYWAWDAGRNGYLWVSACWRAAPANMYWVPGYWAKVPEGWEWVAGFWAPTGAQKIQYLPAPPALDDVQPPGLPPSPDSIWVPSCQYWSQDHYVPRAGYWMQEKPGWVWVPSHYVWTPRGYVFVGGHWDYSLDRRGVLFAPVYFPRSVYTRPGFSYSPSIVIDIGILEVSLFTYPRYSHYCFGDYYDDAYLRLGIFPRFESEGSRTWYDPIFEYDRWQNRRTDPRWEENERHQYDLRRADTSLRPARTYHEMVARQAKLPEAQRRDHQMAQPLSRVVANKATPLKFEPVSSSERKKITTQATNLHKFRDQRNSWESPAASKKTMQPLAESKGAVTPPSERRESAPASVDRRGPTTGPAASTPTDRKGPATSPTASTPTDRKGPATGPTASTPTDRKGPATPPTVSTPPERPSGFVSPRALKVTKPETVKIPKPPIVGKSATASKREAAPPAKPVEERQTTRDTKSKDTSKNKDKEKN
ncbi:MAG: hypothetical protein NTZ17_02260 [Phycisphaerae bacterium]|nr:hypothetical protein [Phycisphaerae bacterium]